MGTCGPGVLEHEHPEHLPMVGSGKLWLDGHLIVAQLGTAVDDMEDDNGLLDDKSPSASFDFHQKILTAHSFSF